MQESCLVNISSDCSPCSFIKDIYGSSPFDKIYMNLEKTCEAIKSGFEDCFELRNLEIKNCHIKPIYDTIRVIDKRYDGEIWYLFSSEKTIDSQYKNLYFDWFFPSKICFEKSLKSSGRILLIRHNSPFEDLSLAASGESVDNLRKRYLNLVDAIASVRGNLDFEIWLGSSFRLLEMISVENISFHYVFSSNLEQVKDFYGRIRARCSELRIGRPRCIF